MRPQIEDIITRYWEERLPALRNVAADAARRIDNFLVLEDYYRGARKDEARMRRSFGGFGGEAIDLRSLSSVLQRGYDARGMARERYDTLRRLAGELSRARSSLAEHPPGPAFADMARGVPALLEDFERHVAPLADTMRLVRIARLEARAAYDPAEHDPFFAAFNWRQLDNEEMALCPPFVVFTTPGAHFGEYLGDLLELVHSGRPLKLVLLQPGLHEAPAETGRAAALRGSSDAALLFLALRNVFFMQTSAAAPTPLDARVAQALDSPRPAVVSLFAPGEELEARSARALASRAFPHFAFDPDRAPDFVSCLDLSDNPEPEAACVTETLAYLDDNGEPAELKRPLTFADYAAGDPAFAAQFEPLPGERADKAVSLPDYLELTPDARWDKVPFVHALDDARRLVRRVPSQAVIAQTTDRQHLWHTLQELAGIQNPFVQAAERRVREQLAADKEQALAAQQATLQRQLEAREEEAVATAMRNLAVHLTSQGGAAAIVAGARAGQAAASAPPAQPEAAGAAPAPEAAPAPPDTGEPAAGAPAAEEAAGGNGAGEVSAEPWIDERLCTSCDECIAINKRIFAYNGSKKAYIKDARGGPYKDVVRAAEKCSSGAIHPGLPLDPEEKDADKWIARAEPYQ